MTTLTRRRTPAVDWIVANDPPVLLELSSIAQQPTVLLAAHLLRMPPEQLALLVMEACLAG